MGFEVPDQVEAISSGIVTMRGESGCRYDQLAQQDRLEVCVVCVALPTRDNVNGWAYVNRRGRGPNVLRSATKSSSWVWVSFVYTSSELRHENDESPD